MHKISDIIRTKRLIEEVIEKLDLSLENMSVLTEAASGNFIVTPLIAAIAGADKVYVTSKDSEYGNIDQIKEYLYDLIEEFNIDKEKIIYVEEAKEIVKYVNIVTNLRGVRPINRELIQRLPYDAAIPLMWESWEARSQDIDYKVCLESNIPILGTKETDNRLRIFRYVGMTAIKLLFERNIEVFKSNILIISSGEYLKEISFVCESNGANIMKYNPFEEHVDKLELKMFLKKCDAIIVAEQTHKDFLITNTRKHINIDWIMESKPIIIHIAGKIDCELLKKYNLEKYPKKEIENGHMLVTTDYVGVRPVIELHTAGLKVGQLLVNGMRYYKDVYMAKQYALQNDIAMEFELEFDKEET